VSGDLESNAYDFPIETFATTAALAEMIRAIRPRGTLVLKSRTPLPVGIDIGAAAAKELTFRAVCYGSFRQAIGLLAERGIELDNLLGLQVPPVPSPAESPEQSKSAGEGTGGTQASPFRGAGTGRLLILRALLTNSKADSPHHYPVPTCSSQSGMRLREMFGRRHANAKSRPPPGFKERQRCVRMGRTRECHDGSPAGISKSRRGEPISPTGKQHRSLGAGV